MGKNARTIQGGAGGAKPLGAADLALLAEGVSGPTKDVRKAGEWSHEEASACLAMVKAGLRLGSMERIDAALAAFGGLPPMDMEGLGVSAMDQAAMDPKAFGFARLAGIRQAAMVSKKAVGPTWLRGGLCNSPWDDARRNWTERLRAHDDRHPVVICLAQDNPVALAALLGDAERFEALAAMEPTPMANPPLRGKAAAPDSWGRQKKELIEAAWNAPSTFETSLIWHAVVAKAFRCAALLAAVPEFSRPLALVEGFAAGSDDSGWMRRTENGVFVEEDEVEFSFFEWMLGAKASVSGFSGEERMSAAWAAMVGSAVDHAGAQAKSWRQEGTGMGWPEIYFARAGFHRWGAAYDRGGNEFAQREVSEGMAMLDRFEKAGFTVEWSVMAKACSESKALSEWLELRSVGAGQARPSKRVPSL